jgi:hypothetical protein
MVQQSQQELQEAKDVQLQVVTPAMQLLQG